MERKNVKLNDAQAAFMKASVQDGMEFLRNPGLSADKGIEAANILSALSIDNETKTLEDLVKVAPSSRESSRLIRQLLIKAGTDCALNDNDPYGDGDQSIMTKDLGESKAQIYRNLFATGGDIEHWIREYPSNSNIPPFIWNCIKGHSSAVLEELNNISRDNVEGRTRMLEQRVTSMRLSPLLLTIAISKHKQIVERYTEWPLAKIDHIGVIRILLKYGARSNARDVTGKTAIHYGAGSFATEENLKMSDMILAAAWTCHYVGKPIVLDGLIKADYNGMKGTLGGYDTETDRLVFYPDDINKKEFSVKPENMFVLKNNENQCNILHKSVRPTNLVEVQDRMGSISLHEVAMSQRSDVAKFLLKRSDKCLDVEDYTGCSVRGMALVPVMKLGINEVIKKHLEKTAKRKRKKRSIKRDSCEKCGIRARDLGRELSKCGKCLDAVYCSRECQLSDWKANDKNECKEREREGAVVLGEAMVMPKGHACRSNNGGEWAKAPEYKCRPPISCKPNQNFWIKVQSNGIEEAILIYDQTRHCNFLLAPGSLGHEELVEKVSEQKAFLGKKSFFQARFDNHGKCVVFPETSTVFKW